MTERKQLVILEFSGMRDYMADLLVEGTQDYFDTALKNTSVTVKAKNLRRVFSNEAALHNLFREIMR